MKLQDIASLHIELTSACNAACPLCMRTNSGYKYNQDFKNIDVLLNQIDVIINQLRYVYFCGNVGDPLASQHLLTVLRHLRKNPKIKIIALYPLFLKQHVCMAKSQNHPVQSIL